MSIEPSTTDTWAELLVVPENRSAVRAGERLVVAFTRDGCGPRFARPLVFHGPTGCGKSVLVRGLVQLVIAGDTPRTAQTLPAAELPRDVEELAALRDCDLLVIEDVQHLKAADVESLLILLDARSARRKPTVVTASAGPAALSDLPHRLTNRLAGGLVVRLDPFGIASRTRFARWKCESGQLRVSADALDWLAHTADGLRPLAGMIDTLRTSSSARKGELSATQVRELLAAPLPPTPQLERITRTVAQAFRVKPKELLGASRLRTVLVPRQVAMFLAREVAKLPLAVIGQHFGGRDHTTVLNAVRKVATAIKTDAELAGRVRELRGGLE
jgi:chromosomal replication initiator protein